MCRSSDSCQHATSSPADVAFSSSLTAAPVERILSLEWRHRTTTATVRYLPEGPKMGWEVTSRHQGHENRSATLLLKPATSKDCSRGAVSSSETPTLVLNGQKWSVWGLVPFHTSSTYKPHGLAHGSRRSKTYSAHVVHISPPGCSPCHLC